MTKSYRKHPFQGIAKTHRGEVKKAKKQISRSTRNWIDQIDELPKGNAYKKFCHSWRWHPEDGRSWRGEDINDLRGRDWWNLMGK